MDHFSKSDEGEYDFVIHMHSAAYRIIILLYHFKTILSSQINGFFYRI
ncbi:hypothetical protein [Parabacteroides johnsonii]|nr:hypothetical protein [Parabacteroides johnsonii]